MQGQNSSWTNCNGPLGRHVIKFHMPSLGRKWVTFSLCYDHCSAISWAGKTATKIGDFDLMYGTYKIQRDVIPGNVCIHPYSLGSTECVQEFTPEMVIQGCKCTCLRPSPPKPANSPLFFFLASGSLLAAAPP